VGAFLESDDRVWVCTHATFRVFVDRFGVAAFDERLIPVDEFHHVSAGPDNRLGPRLGDFIARDRAHIVAMTGSFFRGDAEAVLSPRDEARFETVTYTCYEPLNGYEYLGRLDLGYCFYSGAHADDILKVLDPAEKTILHIPSVNSRESTKDKIREVEHIIQALGVWRGTDAATGFQLVEAPDGRAPRIADLVDDDPGRRDRVSAALKDRAQKTNRDHVDIIIALGMAKEGFDWIWRERALTVGYRSSLTLIDRINPFGEAYAILAKTPSEESLGRLATVIAERRTSLSPDEARDLAGRAVHFKKERGRLPSFTAADPKAGEFFVLGGQFVHVAAVVEEFVATYGRPDARPRVIHDNGTQSDLLMRSLQRALYKDETGRRVTAPSPGPLFSQLAEADDLESGTIYVKRSQSDHPYVAAHRELIHKIGVTGGDVAARIAHAARDATYLLAAVEVMATWRLYDVNRAKL